MKKILILIIGLILFCSCEEKTLQQRERENMNVTVKNIRIMHSYLN